MTSQKRRSDSAGFDEVPAGWKSGMALKSWAKGRVWTGAEKKRKSKPVTVSLGAVAAACHVGQVEEEEA